MTGSNRVLILSNGVGEDHIAAQLIKALQRNKPNLDIVPAPIIGPGHAYTTLGLSPLFSQDFPPSGGFLRTPISWIKDLKKGLLSTHFQQLKTLKSIKQSSDYSIAVGDIAALALTAFHNPHPIIFLPTAKSDHFMPHSALEIAFMKQHCQAIYCRDALTAKNLSKKGLPAYFLGNPMMDGLVPTDNADSIEPEELPEPSPDTPHHIALLPGSREEAYKNLLLILQLIEALRQRNSTSTFTLIKSKTLTLPKLRSTLQHSPWKLVYRAPALSLYHSQNGLSIPISERFAQSISKAHLVIGLAGTANEQAAFLNRTVITFKGTGPQSSLKRLREQNKLCAPNQVILEQPSLDAKAKAINSILNRTPLALPALPPSQNAAAAIAEHIDDQLS